MVIRYDEPFVEMDFPTSSLRPVPAEITRDQVAQSLSIAESDIISMHQTLWTDILVQMDPVSFAKVKPNIQLINAIEARFVG